jgi:hypothetical protein
LLPFTRQFWNFNHVIITFNFLKFQTLMLDIYKHNLIYIFLRSTFQSRFVGISLR